MQMEWTSMLNYAKLALNNSKLADFKITKQDCRCKGDTSSKINVRTQHQHDKTEQSPALRQVDSRKNNFLLRIHKRKNYCYDHTSHRALFVSKAQHVEQHLVGNRMPHFF